MDDGGEGEMETNIGKHPLDKGGRLIASVQEPYRSGAKHGVKAHAGVLVLFHFDLLF